MTEGGVPRMKRNGARIFKNPPQPHMCIQDFLQGTTAPCYVNVLSWDKIAMPLTPSLPVPLYGGMRVPPPRTKTEAIVFAVMANPEVLRMSGKNAQDPKKRMTFIELLLDFIEAMNTGIIFTRHYTILKDRDITGELKEVWNAVLAIRDSEQRPLQQETWIDAQPSVPQFPQYPEQQQQQEYTPQPPQYHSNITCGRTISNENMHYENYGQQGHSPVISKNEPIFISGPIMSPQYHGNVPQIALDYNYREHNRDGQMVQNIIAAHQQFQHRQTWPQYMNKYMHTNSNLPYGPAVNTSPAMNSSNQIKPFQPYNTYPQQQQQQPHMDNGMHVDIRRMQQQSQIHLNHVQPQYEQLGPYNVQNNKHRISKPHMVQKSNSIRRQEEQFHQDVINYAKINKTPIEKTEESKTVIDLDDIKKEDESIINYVTTLTEKVDIRNSASACIVDETSPCEEKNLIKIEKPTSETRETKTPTAQRSFQKNPCSFTRSNARARKMLSAKGDKHNSVASESPKRSQPTMNSIIKSVFKINPSASGEETVGKRKANGQAKAAATNGKTMCENEERVQQNYTILKKETQEEIVNEIAQISIQDCKDENRPTEVGPVLS